MSAAPDMPEPALAPMPAPIVQNAETVNVDQPRDKIPHVRIVATVTFFILIGFAAISFYVLAKVNDATIKGAVIGTWTTLANLGAGFWLGSSVGGKLNK